MEVTFGDDVQVSMAAPAEYRPGGCGEVVAITKVSADMRPAQKGTRHHTKLYLIEFGDGSAVEVPSAFVSFSELQAKAV